MSQPASQLAAAAVDANQDLDEHGERPDGSRSCSVTFPPDGLPPIRGFWSLTLYNEHHFFHPDELNRYSFGPKNKNLHRAGDGSLTLTASATRPRRAAFPVPAGLLARAAHPRRRLDTADHGESAASRVRDLVAGNGRRDGADERSE
jgi:Protein of unknown function (DUF1214)